MIVPTTLTDADDRRLTDAAYVDLLGRHTVRWFLATFLSLCYRSLRLYFAAGDSFLNTTPYCLHDRRVVATLFDSPPTTRSIDHGSRPEVLREIA